MRGWIGAFAGALVVLGPGASEAAPSSITEPDWVSQPTIREFSEQYPKIANALSIAGRATIACEVNVAGGLDECAVVSEEPRGLGFGQAAINMSPAFKMRPQALNGIPVAGGEVRIPVRFALPPSRANKGLSPASTAANMQQALRLVDARTIADIKLDRMRLQNAFALFNGDGRSDGVSVAARAAAYSALERATNAHGSELRLAYAAAYARLFSEKELSDLADYNAAIRPVILGKPELTIAQAKLFGDLSRIRKVHARATFCTTWRCDVPEDVARVWGPAEPGDELLDAPVWASQPSAANVRATGPSFAAALGVRGLARLRCSLASTGQVENCRILEEAPSGMGFGEAALKLTAGYRLSAAQITDKTVGRYVTVRVGFDAPSIGESPEPPAGSDANMALARKIVASDEYAQTVRRNTEIMIVGMSALPKGADPKRHEAGLAALRSGSASAFDELQEKRARLWSTFLTSDQLKIMADYAESPSERALLDRLEALDAALSAAYDSVFDLISADARKIFCAQQDCEIASSVASPPAAKASSN